MKKYQKSRFTLSLLSTSFIFILMVFAWGKPVSVNQPRAHRADGGIEIQIPINTDNVELGDVHFQKNSAYFNVFNAESRKARMSVDVDGSPIRKVVVAQNSAGSHPVVRVVISFTSDVSSRERRIKPVVEGSTIIIRSGASEPGSVSKKTNLPKPIIEESTPEKPVAENPIPGETPKEIKEPRKYRISYAVDTLQTETITNTPPDNTKPNPTPVAPVTIDKSNPTPTIAEPPITTAKKEETPKIVLPPLQKRVNGAFRNEELSYVIRTLASRCGLNIYSGLKMEGKISVEFKDEPVLQAMERILEPRGYQVVAINTDSIKITAKTPEANAKETASGTVTKPVTQLFTVELDKAVEVKEAILNYLKQNPPAQGQPASEISASTVVIAVTAPVELMDQINQIIRDKTKSTK